ncbi:MAG: sigma 54-interacting transcriptional regulator, partial [Myxococcota bacterium]
KALRLEVVEGPDAGKTYDASSDSVSVGSAPGNDLVLSDPTVSRHHLELSLAEDRISVVDHDSTNFTMVGPVHITRATVRPDTVLTLGRSRVKVSDGRPIAVAVYNDDDLHGLKGRSPKMRRLMAQIAQVARSDASVLILGETGTGKERIAEAIHRASPRADEPFEIVDCGALMPTLIASELFGHEKGAFTGANHQHKGAFERAHGGTLFLDELGELPANLQVRLLGALERRAFKRVGGTKAIEVDVRVVSATHRDLRKWVNNGEFRQDLYYRVAVARLAIAPLRERPEDIPLLIEHFLQEMGEDAPLSTLIPDSVMDALTKHHWPGNVRELRNFVESALAFGEAPPIERTEVTSGQAVAGPSPALLEKPYREARDTILQEFQIAYFKRLLERAEGNVSRAANLARMNRPHLIQLLKRYGLR